LANPLELPVRLGPKKALTRHPNPVFICAMKSKTLLVTLALCFATGTACFAANANMGTWKLNAKKSKLNKGMGRNNTVVYSSMFFQTKVTVDGIDEHGKPTHSEWTGMFDGKDHPVTGSANEDTRAYKKIDDRTLEFMSKKGGKMTINGRIAVSPDGKSRTVITDATDAKGKKHHSVAVYDKA
jgi:hypothetical protein